MITCSWCGKKWTWDWDQDIVVGLESVQFTNPADPEVVLDLYLCSCGGSLAVYTHEPFGATVLEFNDSAEE